MTSSFFSKLAVLGFCLAMLPSAHADHGDSRYGRSQTWNCGILAQDGRDYRWRADDRYEAERAARNTCNYYSGQHYCQAAADCYLENDQPDYGTNGWHCEVRTYDGQNYAWNDRDQYAAANAARNTCINYRGYDACRAEPSCWRIRL